MFTLTKGVNYICVFDHEIFSRKNINIYFKILNACSRVKVRYYIAQTVGFFQ